MKNSFLFSLLLCALASAAAAAPKTARVRVAVMPLAAAPADLALAELFEKTVAGELSQSGLFQLPPPKTVQTKLGQLKKKKIFGPNCQKQPACIKLTGLQLGSSVLYFLDFSLAGEKATLTVQTFDVKSGKLIRNVSESCSSEKESLEKSARWAARLASGPIITGAIKGKGKLKVNSTVADAEIIVNGKSFGKRVGKTFTVDPGAFDIMVRKEGYRPFREVVFVKPNVVQEVSAALEAEEKPLLAAEAPKAEKPAEPPQPLKKEEKPDLPAWAIFEAPKKAEPLLPQPQPKDSGALAMPIKEKPASADQRHSEKGASEEKPFWQTWWFWTIIGSAVAAGAGTTTYFLLSSGGGPEPAGSGSAVVQWE